MKKSKILTVFVPALCFCIWNSSSYSAETSTTTLPQGVTINVTTTPTTTTNSPTKAATPSEPAPKSTPAKKKTVPKKKPKPVVKTKLVNCVVEFAQNRWDVDTPKLKSCYGNLNKEDFILFNLFINPAPNVNYPQDKFLWGNRKASLQKELSGMYPKTKINAKTWNKIKTLQDSALVVATVRIGPPKKEDVVIVPVVLQQEKPKPEPKPIAASANFENTVCIIDNKTCDFPTALLGKKCSVIILSGTGELCKENKVEPAVLTVPATCPACERIVEKNPKPFETKFWLGVEFVYVVGNFSTYVPQLFQGTVVGLSQTLTQLSSQNDLYVSLVADFANSSQNMTVKSVAIQSIYYMMNVQFLVGAEHFLKTGAYSLSLYGDAGLVAAQRAFLVATPGGSTNNYDIAVEADLGINAGMNYVYKINDHVGILGKLNLNVIAGLPRNQSVYSSTGTVIDTVNDNPILVMPSLSIGVRF